MDLAIPSKFSSLLHCITDELSSAVGAAFSKVMPILTRNESPFFPDYTDHGIQHIESVLQTCETLISDESWSIFTREDTATLLLAVISHDIGMLIEKEGFEFLITAGNEISPALEQNDTPWTKLWREFQLATRRFNGATLMQLLGSPEPVPLEEFNSGNYTERGIKIVGEFLRRHHHRLAHEIVIFGMPSSSGRIPLFDDSPSHLVQVAGLVARSHGVNIRECLDSLIQKDKTAHREYRHIHPAFLMSLIRLADYLDLDHGRAPSSVLSAKSLKSPISKREWWAHKAVVNCHSYTDDPECLHVVIETNTLPDIETYTTVEDKVIGIQQELDSCWAVLGEVYGRYPPLNRLTLKIRRIRSDLRQSIIIDKLPFVPTKASLDSSKSDLLKLLIAPLYGDIPSIGVRELLQNSIDAVRELEYTISNSTDIASAKLDDLPGNILINFEQDKDDRWWIVVNDQGIGMTWETVKKYYLTAGASFRQSNVWKKQFENDESNTSQVLRSGRFGVGILAAFLLGDRVQVSTRYVDSPCERGIIFEFGLDDTTIELRWKTRNVGTTVKVRLDEKAIKALQDDNLYYYNRNNWDWYCLTKPKVIRIDQKGATRKQKFNLPDVNGKLSADQHAIVVPGYKAIHWTYNKKHPRLVCNGIHVTDIGGISVRDKFGEKARDSKYLNLGDPNISVFDPDGLLPLNLARDSIASTPEILSSALVNDICKNFIAYCLHRGPSNPLLHGMKLDSYSIKGYNGYESHYPDRSKFFWFLDCQEGFALCNQWIFSELSPKIGLLIRAQNDISRLNMSTNALTSNYDVLWGQSTNNKLGDFDDWHRHLVFRDLSPFLINLKTYSTRTLMPRNWFDRFTKSQPQFILRMISIEEKQEDWVIWTNGLCNNPNTTLKSIAEEFCKNNISFESLSECSVDTSENNHHLGRIAETWKQDIGRTFIPFDEGERKNIIRNLGPEYDRHLAQWKAK